MKKWIACLLFFTLAFLITIIHTGVIRTGRQISLLQQAVQIQEAQNQYEQLEITRLSSPEEVTTYARELGLVEARPHEVIVLEDK